jgi:hypothetical protein
MIAKIFFKNTITGDETWVYGYDVETRQSSHRKKAQQVRTQVMHAIFYYRGTAHYEFAPEGHTVNQDCYLAVPRRLWDAV